MKRAIPIPISLLLLIILNALSLVCYAQQENKDNYVVVGQNEGLGAQIQVVGSDTIGFVGVKINDTRFPGGGHTYLLDSLNGGRIGQLHIGNKNIALINGMIEKGGFIETKDFGKIRLLGNTNPFDIWVTPEQKERFLKYKYH